MKITLIQHNIVWASPESNIALADRLVSEAEKADLYVLPEMFSTGFAMDPEGIAEEEGGLTLQWMKRKARETGGALAGSVSIKSGTRFYNRFYFVEPNGHISTYDKRHLFAYGGENRCFTPGNERVVVEYRGMRILLLTCYDLRFPVWSRCRNDYDMILYVANWPVGRMEAWHTLLRARALENQCFVAGVNRTGKSPDADYTGGSVLINPLGKVVAECMNKENHTATGEVSAEKVAVYRERFPAWHDADAFILNM